MKPCSIERQHVDQSQNLATTAEYNAEGGATGEERGRFLMGGAKLGNGKKPQSGPSDWKIIPKNGPGRRKDDVAQAIMLAGE